MNRFIFLLFLYNSCFLLSASFAERPCAEIIAQFEELYAKPLACARRNCPNFKFLDALNEGALECTDGCLDDRTEEFAPTEEELVRCRDSFQSDDQPDIFAVSWCLSASKEVATIYEPFSACIRSGSCAGNDAFNSAECLDQCGEDASQVVEVSTTTMERCGDVPKAKTSICKMLSKVINVCFVPEHCKRLENILKLNCASE